MTNSKIYVIIGLIAAAVIGTAAFSMFSIHTPAQVSPVSETNIQKNITIQTPIQNLKKFNSTDELKLFLIDSQVKSSTQYSGPMFQNQFVRRDMLEEAMAPSVLPVPTTGAVTSGEDVKYSTTNVQVGGIDEPDFS